MTRMQVVDRERVIFAAGIAHELPTPLTILKGRLHGRTGQSRGGGEDRHFGRQGGDCRRG
jgi:signal transduction histidine kinase